MEIGLVRPHYSKGKRNRRVWPLWGGLKITAKSLRRPEAPSLLTPTPHNIAPTDGPPSTDRIVVGETLFNLFVEFPRVGHLKLPAAARGIQITCGRVSRQRIVNLVATTVSWC